MRLQELRQYREAILDIAGRNNIHNVRVFGSVARGEETDESDIDFLVTPGKGVGWEFFGCADKISDLLHCKVDFVSDRAIHPFLKEGILRDAVPL
jgi:predicted nucleotidyltransferase